MKLSTTSSFPPGGYAMRNAAIGFDVRPGTELALRGFSFVVAAYQQACIHNAAQGCNPDIDACEQAVMQYNYDRLPVEDRGRFFRVVDEGVAPVAEAVAPADASQPVKRRGGCRSCGGRR